MILLPAITCFAAVGPAPCDGASGTALQDVPTPAVKMVDLNGDRLPDRLLLGRDGSIAIAINRGARVFDPVPQILPSVRVEDVLAEDLDRDGVLDLYLVASGANVLLLGDGSGGFVEATELMGLVDFGPGRSAELLDLDGDEHPDVLLHNESGDVVFYAAGGRGAAFERDPDTPTQMASALPVAPWIAGRPPLDTPSAVGTTEPLADDVSITGGSTPMPRPVSIGSVRRSLASTPGAGSTSSTLGAPPTPSVGSVVSLALPAASGCATSVIDATTKNCLLADSTPTLNRLLPIGTDFYVGPDGAGFGTTAPEGDLHVVGDASEGRLVISPEGAFLNRDAVIALSESGPGGLECGVEIRYDGDTTNQLQFNSSCTSGFETALAIARLNGGSGGQVGIGTTDLASNSMAGPGHLKVDGDVSQSLASDGLVKAAVHVNGNTVTISRSFTELPDASAPTLTRLGIGAYEIDFKTDVSTRFYQATLGTAIPGNAANGTIDVSPRSGNVNAVFVCTRDTDGVSIENQFFLTIF